MALALVNCWTKQKQRYGYMEQNDSCQREEGHWVKEGEGISHNIHAWHTDTMPVCDGQRVGEWGLSGGGLRRGGGWEHLLIVPTTTKMALKLFPNLFYVWARWNAWFITNRIKQTWHCTTLDTRLLNNNSPRVPSISRSFERRNTDYPFFWISMMFT